MQTSWFLFNILPVTARLIEDENFIAWFFLLDCKKIDIKSLYQLEPNNILIAYDSKQI